MPDPIPDFGPWTLSGEEKQRLADYRRYQEILGRHARKHDPLLSGFGIGPTLQHLWVNIPKMICKVSADLVLPYPPRFTSEDEEVQARLNALAKRSKLNKLCWKALYWTSGLGDGYVTIADVSGRPALVFRRATGSVGRNLRDEDDPAAREFVFDSVAGSVDVFTHFAAGVTTNSAYRGNEQVALPAGYVARIETGEAVALAAHIAALPQSHQEPFGESQIEDIIEFSWEIANRIRQCKKILDDHAEPAVNLPQGVVDERGTFNPRTVKAIERDFNGNGMEYVTWDSRIAEAFLEIDRMIDLILLITETPPALFGRDKSGTAESGRALKFRLLNGLSKARRNGGGLTDALETAARLALRREDILADKTPGDYTDIGLALPDTFLSDETESAQEVQLLRAAGAMSIENAVKQGQGLSGDELNAEVARIQTENPAPQAAPIPGWQDNNSPGLEPKP